MISNPFTDPRWAKKTVEAIDRWVDFISDKTTRPIANLVRLVVFGVIAVVATITIIVLALIGIRRRPEQPGIRPAGGNHGPLTARARAVQLLGAGHRQHGSAGALRQ